MMNMVLQRHLAYVINTNSLSTFSKKVSLALTFLLIVGCSHIQYPEVTASYETAPVVTAGDAADDAAIWVNQSNPSQSMVLGTDKKSGVYSYDLAGVTMGYTELGKINNIDLRTQQGQTYIFGSNRTTQTVDLWIYKEEEIAKSVANMDFKLSEDRFYQGQSAINIYGICAGFDKELGLIAFITEDEGPRVEVWQYMDNSLQLIHTFDNGGESEGCVYDDENRRLLISEEEVNGVLRAYNVSAELDFSNPVVIDSRQGHIGGDPEGVTLYKTSNSDGYIILSSQGDSKFNLYERNSPFKYIGSFRVGDKTFVDETVIDGVSITDGIAAVNVNLNQDFRKGLLVVQDNDNFDEDDKYNQNFKFVSFDKVLKLIPMMNP